jgi:hypothetical protein
LNLDSSTTNLLEATMNFALSRQEYGTDLNTTLRLDGIAALKDVELRASKEGGGACQGVARYEIDELWTVIIQLGRSMEEQDLESSSNVEKNSLSPVCVNVYLKYTGKKSPTLELKSPPPAHISLTLKSLCHQVIWLDPFDAKWEDLQDPQSDGYGASGVLPLDKLCENPSVKADDAVLLTIRIVSPPPVCGDSYNIRIRDDACYTVVTDFKEVFRGADVVFRLYRCAPPKKRKRNTDITTMACTKTIFANRKVLGKLCSYFEGSEYLSQMSDLI